MRPSRRFSGLVRALSAEFIPRPANQQALVTEQLQIPKGVLTTAIWPGEVYDTGTNPNYPNGFWDAANPTRLTATVSGFYVPTAWLDWSSGVGTYRYAQFTVNGALAWGSDIKGTVSGGPRSTSSQLLVGIQRFMSAGEYFELDLEQDSGGNLGCVAYFGIMRIP